MTTLLQSSGVCIRVMVDVRGWPNTRVHGVCHTSEPLSQLSYASKAMGPDLWLTPSTYQITLVDKHLDTCQKTPVYLPLPSIARVYRTFTKPHFHKHCARHSLDYSPNLYILSATVAWLERMPPTTSTPIQNPNLNQKVVLRELSTNNNRDDNESGSLNLAFITHGSIDLCAGCHQEGNPILRW